MSGEIVAIERGAAFDNRIVEFEYRTHAPYASNRYGNNDEIRIPIQQQDVFTLTGGEFSVHGRNIDLSLIHI